MTFQIRETPILPPGPAARRTGGRRRSPVKEAISPRATLSQVKGINRIARGFGVGSSTVRRVLVEISGT